MKEYSKASDFYDRAIALARASVRKFDGRVMYSDLAHSLAKSAQLSYDWGKTQSASAERDLALAKRRLGKLSQPRRIASNGSGVGLSKHRQKIVKLALASGEGFAIICWRGSSPLFITLVDGMDAINKETLETLYDWYVESFQQTAISSRPARVALGYADTAVEPRLLEIAEFERWLNGEWKGDQLREAWLRTFTEGRKAEFESLMKSARSAA